MKRCREVTIILLHGDSNFTLRENISLKLLIMFLLTSTTRLYDRDAGEVFEFYWIDLIFFPQIVWVCANNFYRKIRDIRNM